MADAEWVRATASAQALPRVPPLPPAPLRYPVLFGCVLPLHCREPRVSTLSFASVVPPTPRRLIVTPAPRVLGLGPSTVSHFVTARMPLPLSVNCLQRDLVPRGGIELPSIPLKWCHSSNDDCPVYPPMYPAFSAVPGPGAQCRTVAGGLQTRFVLFVTVRPCRQFRRASSKLGTADAATTREIVARAGVALGTSFIYASDSM